MMTVGQRIKTYRKAKQYSQADLAERIGVSCQSVSKWENDLSTPDITQIVPLAKVLGTSADAILCMYGDESDAEAELCRDLEEICGSEFDIHSMDPKLCDTEMKCFERLEKFVHKYPLNYRVMLQYGSFGARVASSINKGYFSELSEKAIKAIQISTERALKAVITYDTDYGRKAEAKQKLILLYTSMNDYERAYAECEGLSERDKILAKYRIANNAGDFDNRLEYAKEKLCLDFKALTISFSHLCGSFHTPIEPSSEKYTELFNTLVQHCKYDNSFVTTDIEKLKDLL